MNELSLFSGAGGGLLATQHLLGWRTIGYVEIDDYCQRVLRARIDDAMLDEAPIFGDVREFVDSGAAQEYRGAADVVTAGFPCQPFSAAGKKLGGGDGRNLWPETAECLRLVRPRFVLLENVPGMLAHRYFDRVLADLAALGFDVRWDCLPASALGAPHQRDRLWIAASMPASDAERDELRQQWERDGEQHRQPGKAEPRDYGEAGSVANAGRSKQGRRKQSKRGPNRRDDPRRGSSEGKGSQELGGALPSWWLSEPDVGRVAHGVASRIHRLRALGNGQVPAVVAAAWRLLA